MPTWQDMILEHGVSVHRIPGPPRQNIDREYSEALKASNEESRLNFPSSALNYPGPDIATKFPSRCSRKWRVLRDGSSILQALCTNGATCGLPVPKLGEESLPHI